MVSNWLYHWVYLDFYVPVWPNIAASVVVFVFLYMKIKSLERLHKSNHAQLKKHLGIKDGD